MVLRAAVEPMLINAIMTRTEREKRMLLMGTGVPMTAIWRDVSSTTKSRREPHNLPCGTRAKRVGLGLGLVPRPGEKRRRVH
jgi:hypothetical protein